MKLDTWGLPAALQKAGLVVVETENWATRSQGELPNSPTVVWHHDASPPGDSPGALKWMISNWDTASAQVWISRLGYVYLVGAGMAWHAGAVLPDMHGFDNYRSVGIETDHTTGEDWPPAQLAALRLTTAVILDLGKRPRSAFSFHKLICSPVGRKSDPDGLDLTHEREAVAAVLVPDITKPSGNGGDDMASYQEQLDRMETTINETKRKVDELQVAALDPNTGQAHQMALLRDQVTELAALVTPAPPPLA